MASPKQNLQDYLDAARDAVLWKLDGVSEYDLRRPMTPTGTNLLGVLKHLAAVESGYLGECFGWPFPEPFPGDGEGESVHADMFAREDESPADVLSYAARVRAHADATIAALDLEAPGSVSWWAEGARDVTLHEILVRLVGEWNRHAGHIDILREQLDGMAGYRPGVDNLPPEAEAKWAAHVAHLQEIADRHR